MVPPFHLLQNLFNLCYQVELRKKCLALSIHNIYSSFLCSAIEKILIPYWSLTHLQNHTICQRTYMYKALSEKCLPTSPTFWKYTENLCWLSGNEAKAENKKIYYRFVNKYIFFQYYTRKTLCSKQIFSYLYMKYWISFDI